MKTNFAKSVRILSAPPCMIFMLIWMIAKNNPAVFYDWKEIGITLLFLGVVPSVAYLPFYCGDENEKRKNQRKNAFILTLASDTMMLVWVNIFAVSKELQLIAHTYFFSIVFLSFVNHTLKQKASGHASSFTGPVLLSAYLIGWKWSIPWCILGGMVSWASVYLKRHTVKQIIEGMLVCIASFGIAWLALR